MSKRGNTIGGTLLVVVILVLLVWQGIKAFTPAKAAPTETVPATPVDSLKSEVLNELAKIADEGNNFGLPINKPGSDTVGKSPLL